MKKCPKCNWENRDDDAKCVLCAADLSGGAVATAPQTESPSTYSYQGQPTENRPPEKPAAKTTAYEPAIRSAAHWFYWIAGLSIINTVMMLVHLDRSFVIGLAITQGFDYLATEKHYLLPIILLVNLMIEGLFILFGYFAGKRARWAFITGIVLYGLDTLLVLAIKEWFTVAFHILALFCISRGLVAVVAARKAEKPAGPVI